MRWALLSYCLGILAPVFASDIFLFTKFGLLLLLGSAFFALVTARGRALTLRRHLLFISSACFATGMLWHGLWANLILQQRLQIELEGVDMNVQGLVLSLPERNQLSQQFEFYISDGDQLFSARKVLLNYYGDQIIEPGQRWRFLLRLNRPHGFANPGGFDYEAWLFQRGLAAKGYVRSSSTNTLLSEPGCAFLCGSLLLSRPSITASINSLRYRLRNALLAQLEDSRYGGIMLALVLGDRGGITATHWQLLTDTGSNHLFVISGLHIGMIAGFCFYLARLLLRFIPCVALYIPMQKLAALAAIFAATAYALLAGFSLPTQRALVMIAVFMFGYLSHRRYLVSFRFLLALALVLSLNPLAALNAGFWFSFVAVGALLACMDSAGGADDSVGTSTRLNAFARKTYRYNIRPQLIVFIALLVPLVFWTGQLSLLAPLVNVFAIPLIGFIVLPLCLLAVLLMSVSELASQASLYLAELVLASMFEWGQWLVQLGGEKVLIPFAALEPWQLISSALAFMLLLLPRGIVHRGLVIPLGLPLLIPAQQSQLDAGVLNLHILDVGQGLAIIVQTANHALVYDTGAELSLDFNIGAAVLVPALRSLGINTLDRVVISHGDNDHAGGLSGVLAAVPVETIYSSSEQLATRQQVLPCHGEQRWYWDGIEFQFLSIHGESVRQVPGESSALNSMNNSSCVLQLKTGRNAVLLPGDIEVEAERKLALNYGAQLESAVIVAPHHGSKTSSSYSLLKNVNPDYVLYSAGYQNSFNHPSEVIEARYREFSAHAVSTADSGMISFIIEPESPLQTPTRYREQNRRYWH